MTKLRTHRHVEARRCRNVIEYQKGQTKRCTRFTKHPTGWCKTCRRSEGHSE